MSINKVISYLHKYAGNDIPKPDGTRIELPAGNNRVKGSLLEQWRIKGLSGGLCHKCNIQVRRLTVDHIIPIHILSALDNAFDIAVNDENNFQFLCEICNRIKSGSLNVRDPRTARLLVKYMTPYLSPPEPLQEGSTSSTM